MKCCINKKCFDKFIGGTVYDIYCPRCGKKLYDSASQEVQKLIKSGWYNKNDK